MKKSILAILAALFLVSGCTDQQPQTDDAISSFEECLDAGYPVMESYPRQCAVPGGKTFTEEIEQEPENPELYCEQDSDCACGTHVDTGECFYGNKDYVDTDVLCPDFWNFCTWENLTPLSMELKCVNNVCTDVTWADADSESYCEQDSDCACGTHVDTGECFYGNVEYVIDTMGSGQCTNFCTLTNGVPVDIKCVNDTCLQVRNGNDVTPQPFYDNETQSEMGGNTTTLEQEPEIGNNETEFEQDSEEPEIEEDQGNEAVGIANPASVHCLEHNGTLEIVDTEAGQVGYCHLPWGKTCEEWTFYRGECEEEDVAGLAIDYCLEQNGTIETRDTDDGRITDCHLPWGVTCEAWSFYNEECG